MQAEEKNTLFHICHLHRGEESYWKCDTEASGVPEEPCCRHREVPAPYTLPAGGPNLLDYATKLAAFRPMGG